MPKILVIRFSSIGDIVLTTPVLRCIKEQVGDASIHYLTRRPYVSLLQANPHIDQIHAFDDDLEDTLRRLRKEQFDFVVDLHHNLRTWRVKRSLKRPGASFHKLNIAKWLMVRFKWNRLPDEHIVQRYIRAASGLGVIDDGKGLEHFIPPDTNDQRDLLPDTYRNGFIALVIGAQHATKKLPLQKLQELLDKLSVYRTGVVIIGGPEDASEAEALCTNRQQVFSMCGISSLQESALLIKHAVVVITHDTGMMHIAAALKKQVISVWGNTIPEFGMYPYFGSQNTLYEQRAAELLIENTSLSCRPCSKIGFEACPKGHFRCMMDLNMEAITGKAGELNATANQ